MSKIAFALFMVFWALPGSAQLTCENEGDILMSQAADQVNGLFSDTNCDICSSGTQTIADDIALTEAAELGELRFYGGYFPNNIPTTPDTFVVYIHADVAGLPGAVTQTISNAATTREITGVTLFGVDQYLYTMSFSPALALAAGRHWISIINTTTNPDDWFWETGTWDTLSGAINGAFAFEAPGTIWSLNQGVDQSLLVCGPAPEAVPPKPVPLLGGWGLFLLVLMTSLAGYGFFKRRQQ